MSTALRPGGREIRGISPAGTVVIRSSWTPRPQCALTSPGPRSASGPPAEQVGQGHPGLRVRRVEERPLEPPPQEGPVGMGGSRFHPAESPASVESWEARPSISGLPPRSTLDRDTAPPTIVASRPALPDPSPSSPAGTVRRGSRRRGRQGLRRGGRADRTGPHGGADRQAGPTGPIGHMRPPPYPARRLPAYGPPGRAEAPGSESLITTMSCRPSTGVQRSVCRTDAPKSPKEVRPALSKILTWATIITLCEMTRRMISRHWVQ